MLNAATKIDLPILINFPSFNKNPFNSWPLLGLGDILLPGFVINYLFRFGKKRNSEMYYIISIIFYGISLFWAIILLLLTKYP